MKKALSIIMSLALLLSFAMLFGCKTEEVQPSDEPSKAVDEKTPEVPDNEGITEEMLAASKPNEYVAEKLAAGMAVTVAHNPATLESIAWAQHLVFETELPKLGYTYVAAAWNHDGLKQIEQIENWITMGLAAIFVSTPDPAGQEDIVSKAEDAGTSIIFYGTVPDYYYSAASGIDVYELGYSSGLIARAWLDANYPDAQPGEIKAAVFGFYVVPECGWISDAVKQAFNDDPRIDLVFTHDYNTSIDEGFSRAEDAFTANPDLKVIGTMHLDAAFGASNYIMTIPNVNTDEYCVVGTTYSEDVPAFLEQANNGQGAFRGTANGIGEPGWDLLHCLDMVLIQGAEKPYVYMEEIGAIAGFDFDFATYYAANR